jgi:hypothetical protein
VRYGLFDFGIGKPFAKIFALPMQGRKVLKLPERPYPKFPDMGGRIIEFSREGCQVQAFDIHYGHKLTTGVGKGHELAQWYIEGLNGAV